MDTMCTGLHKISERMKADVLLAMLPPSGTLSEGWVIEVIQASLGNNGWQAKRQQSIFYKVKYEISVVILHSIRINNKLNHVWMSDSSLNPESNSIKRLRLSSNVLQCLFHPLWISYCHWDHLSPACLLQKHVQFVGIFPLVSLCPERDIVDVLAEQRRILFLC